LQPTQLMGSGIAEHPRCGPVVKDNPPLRTQVLQPTQLKGSEIADPLSSVVS